MIEIRVRSFSELLDDVGADPSSSCSNSSKGRRWKSATAIRQSPILVLPAPKEDLHDIGTARMTAPKRLPINEGMSDFQMYKPTTKGIRVSFLPRHDTRDGLPVSCGALSMIARGTKSMLATTEKKSWIRSISTRSRNDENYRDRIRGPTDKTS